MFHRDISESGISGDRLVLPPGVVVDGIKMDKYEAKRYLSKKRDEEFAVAMSQVEAELQSALDVEEDT